MFLLFLLLITPIKASFDIPCDFVEYDSIRPENSGEVYIVRDQKHNRGFRDAFTLDTINKTMHDQQILKMNPYNHPSNFEVDIFSTFVQDHILKYDDLDIEDILNDTLEPHMIYPFLNHTHSIIPKYISRLHTCDYCAFVGLKRHPDFFMGTKGQGVNFHQHNEIFHHLYSGKKIWFIVNDFTVIENTLNPDNLIAGHVRELIDDDRVRKCIVGPNDIIHVPRMVVHGTFHLERTMAAACLITTDRNQMYPKTDIKTILNNNEL